jgi:hypothetical protein
VAYFGVAPGAPSTTLTDPARGGSLAVTVPVVAGAVTSLVVELP